MLVGFRGSLGANSTVAEQLWLDGSYLSATSWPGADARLQLTKIGPGTFWGLYSSMLMSTTDETGQRSVMRSSGNSERLTVEGLRDAVDTAALGSGEALTAVMRQNNGRMFRIARSILRNDAEAEDIVQDAFLKAFTELDGLREASSIGAWLAKITHNMSLSRLRQMKLHDTLVSQATSPSEHERLETASMSEDVQVSPEQFAAIGDVRRLLEQEIDKLGDGFREVFVLREVEQMSIAETSEILGIPAQTVKTRLHRAKAQLRSGLEDHLTAASLKAFPFGGRQCERTTRFVLDRLEQAVITSLDPTKTHH